MRYLEKINIKELREKYDLLVGWGASALEYEKRYQRFSYDLDYMIDGGSNKIGMTICGHVICEPHKLFEISNKKICVIIFPNLESAITEQIKVFCPTADTVVARLIEIDSRERSFSRDREDCIMLDLIHKIKGNNREKFTYMDIGVCHPVIRNNTYLFYENGYKEGLLVEPNPNMNKLAELYRPENKIVPCGITAGEVGSLTYYYSNENPGYNTFALDVARERGIENNIFKIDVLNINEVIKKHFKRCPDIMDIDTEGMDFEIIKGIDFEKYPIKIICAESDHANDFRKYLSSQGYVHYCSTLENDIFICGKIYAKMK